MMKTLRNILFIVVLALSVNSCQAQFFWSHTKLYDNVQYGLLYNLYAATDSRNIAASGWHVPTNAEFITLQTYLGGATVAGGKLKETGLTYWGSPNTGATNEAMYNGRGAGYRNESGTFVNINTDAFFVASDGFGVSLYYRRLSSVTGSLIGSGSGIPMNMGSSIRLIKNSTTLTHGQTGTYTGNDGKIYRTICIGTQEWLADNLCETKYRNDDLIPEVTDNAAWAALTTGALCAYDNDWNNAY